MSAIGATVDWLDIDHQSENSSSVNSFPCSNMVSFQNSPSLEDSDSHINFRAKLGFKRNT